MNKSTLYKISAWSGIIFLIFVVYAIIIRQLFFGIDLFSSIDIPLHSIKSGTLSINFWALSGILVLPVFFSMSKIGRDIASVLLEVASWVGLFYVLIFMVFNFGLGTITATGNSWTQAFFVFLMVFTFFYLALLGLALIMSGKKLGAASVFSGSIMEIFSAITLIGIIVVAFNIGADPYGEIGFPGLFYILLLATTTYGVLLILPCLFLVPILFKRAKL